mmetsp:Transcript_35435/g.97840  ORF Transcript_35435/g.97840 Transcript_35435/m.97840 type:complete len:236 (-) Transcript_35435:327-1034(-)
MPFRRMAGAMAFSRSAVRTYPLPLRSSEVYALRKSPDSSRAKLRTMPSSTWSSQPASSRTGGRLAALHAESTNVCLLKCPRNLWRLDMTSQNWENSTLPDPSTSKRCHTASICRSPRPRPCSRRALQNSSLSSAALRSDFFIDRNASRRDENLRLMVWASFSIARSASLTRSASLWMGSSGSAFEPWAKAANSLKLMKPSPLRSKRSATAAKSAGANPLGKKTLLKASTKSVTEM